MKYFEVLYKSNCNTIEIGAPLTLDEVAIIKDTVDNEILLRNIFFNVSNSRITAIQICIVVTDYYGEPIYIDGQEKYTFTYEDVNSEPDELFGKGVAIKLPDNARKAEVSLIRTVNIHGDIWTSNQLNIVTIQTQNKLEYDSHVLSSLDDNDIPPVFFFVENDSCWQCTCGHANLKRDELCRNCKRKKEDVKRLFDPNNIVSTLTEYKYNNAVEIQKSAKKQKDFENAIKIYSELENYKDTPSRIEECKEAIKSLQHQQEMRKTSRIRIAKRIAAICGGIAIAAIAAIIIINSRPKIIGIDVDYTGETEAGTVLSKSNPGIIVTAQYNNGTTKLVDDWSINENKELKSDEYSTVVISYKQFSHPLQVKCSTREVKTINVSYNGSRSEGSEIRKKDITVWVEYKNGDKEKLSSGWTMKPNKAVLHRGKTTTLTIDYEGITETLTIKCSDISIEQYIEQITDIAKKSGATVTTDTYEDMNVVKWSVLDTNVLSDLKSAKNGNTIKKEKWEAVVKDHIEINDLIAKQLKENTLNDWHVKVDVYNEQDDEAPLLTIVDGIIVFNYVDN